MRPSVKRAKAVIAAGRSIGTRPPIGEASAVQICVRLDASKVLELHKATGRAFDEPDFLRLLVKLFCDARRCSEHEIALRVRKMLA